jgi:hypothetical protein
MDAQRIADSMDYDTQRFQLTVLELITLLSEHAETAHDRVMLRCGFEYISAAHLVKYP